jgi:hypothetical protein
MVNLDKLAVAEALRLAIDALKCVPSFATSTPKPEKPGRMLTSYQLLPMLETACHQQVNVTTGGDVNRVVLEGLLAGEPDIRESLMAPVDWSAELRILGAQEEKAAGREPSGLKEASPESGFDRVALDFANRRVSQLLKKRGNPVLRLK